MLIHLAATTSNEPGEGTDGEAEELLKEEAGSNELETDDDEDFTVEVDTNNGALDV